MSALTAALGAVLAHFTADVQPRSSVLVHIANNAWAELKAEASADLTAMGEQVLQILDNVVQETVSSREALTHTQVQFAAGDWSALRQVHAEATGAEVAPPSVTERAHVDVPAEPQPVAGAPVAAPAPAVAPLAPLPVQ